MSALVYGCFDLQAKNYRKKWLDLRVVTSCMSILLVRVGDASVGSQSSPHDESARSRKQWEWGLSPCCTLAEVALMFTLVWALVSYFCVFSTTVCVHLGLQDFGFASKIPEWIGFISWGMTVYANTQMSLSWAKQIFYWCLFIHHYDIHPSPQRLYFIIHS